MNTEFCQDIEEYAVAYRSGDMKILANFPEVNDIYPLQKRIQTLKYIQGNKIYRRKIIVLEDWSEYDLPD